MSKAIKKIGKAVGKVAKAVGKVVKKIAPVAIPILTFALPGIGTAIGTALGATGTAASALGGAVIGAAGSAITGGNILKGALLGGLGGAAGGFLGGGEAAGTGAFDVAGNADILGGSSAISLGNTLPSLGSGGFDVGGNPDILGGSSATLPTNIIAPQTTMPATDYSLLGGDYTPPTTGLTADLPPLPEANMIGTQPIDYSLTQQTAPTGLQIPTMPNLSAMGGGQGLTADVYGGTVGQMGLTPTGATPVLGNQNSFINNPDVLGRSVMQQGTPATISLQDALRAGRIANSLLNQPQQPQQPIYDTQGMNATGMDYSQLLALLAARARSTGLLGTKFRPQQVGLGSLLG